MDALLTTFIAALLAEFGDKTQLLVIALAVRYRAPAPILAGVAVAALLNSLLAAAGGIVINELIVARAVSLLVALALIFAGVGGLMRQKQPDMGATWKTGAFVTTVVCFFLLEFGDKTQFLTGALAAKFDSFALAALGATAGIIAASIPSLLLADRYPTLAPMKAIRVGIAILFLLVGFIVAVGALRLI